MSIPHSDDGFAEGWVLDRSMFGPVFGLALRFGTNYGHVSAVTQALPS